MTRSIGFLVNNSGSLPDSLPEAIRLLKNSSLGFCNSWLNEELSEAENTSEEAFGLFDHIQNELLRRKEDKKYENDWSSSPFKIILNESIGEIIKPASVTQKNEFYQLSNGEGKLPENSIVKDLSLMDALNKLKHRDSLLVNFKVIAVNQHKLFFFTNAGNGQPNSISTFDVSVFCSACKKAADILNN